MDCVNSATISNASSADLSTVQGAVSVSVMKKALDAQEAAATQLIASLPQAALATSGTLGTKVNTYA